MSVIVTALFPTKVEASENFFNTLVSVLPDTRTFDGCISVTPHRDLDDASRILLIEEWESREHYLAYLQWRVETGLIDAISPMLSSDPVTNFFSGPQD
jgi:quinol monooxygenase YgiN